MLFDPQKLMSQTGIDLGKMSEDEFRELYREVLEEGMHGICFSIYEEGQKPGDIISEEQIRRRMEILRPYTLWVRSFSCIEGNELVPQVAKSMGLKTLVGAWLGSDKDLNEQEIEGLIRLARDGYVDIASVGNEVMYRKDLSEEELLEYIRRVKEAIPGIPVGYVDAYYEFVHRPAITDICDVILANCYPYWEGCHIDYSLIYMKQMYQQAVKAANGKRVIITETGWPSQGGHLQAAVAGEENFMRYFINAQLWSKEDDIEMFYFSSFDEAWKVDGEGDVGAHWGIWDKNGKLKF